MNTNLSNGENFISLDDLAIKCGGYQIQSNKANTMLAVNHCGVYLIRSKAYPSNIRVEI